MRETLTYNDVLLVPQYSDIRSRTEVSLQSNLGTIVCEVPIIASPMDTISETEMAIEMGTLGGLAVVHRYNTIERQCDIVIGYQSYTSGVSLATKRA